MILRVRREIYDGIELDLVLVPKWTSERIKKGIDIINAPTMISIPFPHEGRQILYKHKTEDRICLIAPQENMSHKNNLSLTLLVAGVANVHLHHLPEEDVICKIGEIIQEAYMTITEQIIMESKPEE